MPRSAVLSKIDRRVHKDLDMLGIRNGEEPATDGDRWREVVVAAKDLNDLYLAKKKKLYSSTIFVVKLS